MFIFIAHGAIMIVVKFKQNSQQNSTSKINKISKPICVEFGAKALSIMGEKWKLNA